MKITFEAIDEKELAEWTKVLEAYRLLRNNSRRGGDLTLRIREGRLKFSDFTASTDVIVPSEECHQTRDLG